MSAADQTATYPDFVTDADRHAWDELTPERKQQYLDAVDYVRTEYPDEELSVALIGTVLSFGG